MLCKDHQKGRDHVKPRAICMSLKEWLQFPPKNKTKKHTCNTLHRLPQGDAHHFSRGIWKRKSTWTWNIWITSQHQILKTKQHKQNRAGFGLLGTLWASEQTTLLQANNGPEIALMNGAVCSAKIIITFERGLHAEHAVMHYLQNLQSGMN